MNKYEILCKIKEILIEKKLSLATAESCTGGLLSSYLTDIDGASNFIFQNFVTYSNSKNNADGFYSLIMFNIHNTKYEIKATSIFKKEYKKMMKQGKDKEKFLNVQKSTLETFGAVSEQTASEMALGLLNYADIGACTTGILGPTGGSKEKPIGLVYIGFSYKDNIKVIKYISKLAPTNNRHKIKKDITRYVIQELLRFLGEI